jgi:hypothetical protein
MGGQMLSAIPTTTIAELDVTAVDQTNAEQRKRWEERIEAAREASRIGALLSPRILPEPSPNEKQASREMARNMAKILFQDHKTRLTKALVAEARRKAMWRAYQFHCYTVGLFAQFNTSRSHP